MTEKQLQHEIIMRFGILHPNLRHLLFEINNDTFSKNHALTRRGMGMVPGVSDLIFVNPHTGVITGIELKAKGTRHDSTHILTQLNWGDKLRQTGAFYLLITDTVEILGILDSLICEKPVDEIISKNIDFQNVIRLKAMVKKSISF